MLKKRIWKIEEEFTTEEIVSHASDPSNEFVSESKKIVKGAIDGTGNMPWIQ